MMPAMLSVLERLLVLEEVEAFEALDGAMRLRLARRARSAAHGDGALVAERGAGDDRIVVVVSGEVAVEVDGEVVASLGPGDSLAELALLGRPAARLVARGGAICVTVGRHEIYESTRDEPETAYQVLEEVMRQLRARLQIPLALAGL